VSGDDIVRALVAEGYATPGDAVKTAWASVRRAIWSNDRLRVLVPLIVKDVTLQDFVAKDQAPALVASFTREPHWIVGVIEGVDMPSVPVERML
jgi:hypothetical protein